MENGQMTGKKESQPAAGHANPSAVRTVLSGCGKATPLAVKIRR